MRRLFTGLTILTFIAVVALSLATLFGCHDASHDVSRLLTSSNTCTLAGPIDHLAVWQTTFFSFVVSAIVAAFAALVVAAFSGFALRTVPAAERLRRYLREQYASPNMKVFDPLVLAMSRGVIAGRRQDNLVA